MTSSAPGTPMMKVTPAAPSSGQQIVHIVLVGFGVVGVANVHAQRQAEQLAAKMVLQAGPDDLLAVIQIFGADEADHAVDQQRIEGAGHGIGRASQVCWSTP